ncbi:MAG: hypothetical protein A2V65_07770 [Deltaproteobacteria bacterium RBG_13_49_15]|nr:MAG: hypothetical protein A2V65_07770 [Deltaproteobacteria bacterium RBG_13_49_15]
MIKKKIILAVIVIAISFFLVGNNVWAGSPQRHRWEGVAIGIGAALVGSAIFNHHHYQRPLPAPVPVYQYPPPCYRWQVERVWIPPVYDSVWILGLSNRWGRWSPGRWEQRVRIPGYWEERPVCIQ